ncbi:hypothetical protein HK096_009366 [Nowakowskiella sp. JEL0078]|nr:hypothetical protein HK096_009366 [Nowakowskiella sp. JEL0078]
MISCGARVEKMDDSDDAREFIFLKGPLRIYKGSMPYPGLVVTRSLGDSVATKLGVLSEPDVKILDITPNDSFLILATDGVWDGLSVTEAVNLVSKQVDPTKASEILTQASLEGLDKNSVDDNTTNIVVFLMKSKTKSEVSREDLDKIVQTHLSDTIKSVRENTFGMFNVIFFVETNGGIECVIKISPLSNVPVLRYEKNIIASEVQSMRMFKDDGRVPVPKILAFDESKEIISNSFYIMEKLPGVSYVDIKDKLDENQQGLVDLQIGKIFKIFDEIVGPGFGMLLNPTFKTWREAFCELLDWLKNDAEDANVKLPEGVFELMTDKLYSLDEVKIPVFVHWDLWSGNVVIDPETLVVTGIIDFERSLYGDRLMDFSDYDFLNSKNVYISDLDLEPMVKERKFLYKLYVLLVMVIECTYRGYEAEHENWTRNELLNHMQTAIKEIR